MVFNLNKISNNKSRGISLMEVLIGIAIMGILGSVSVLVFSGLANNISLERDVGIISSYIEKARTMSINSVLSLEHGIKFETNKVTIFKSTSYNVSNIEAVYEIPSKSIISSINLSSGATELYFDKLTGASSRTGTVNVSLADGSETKTITIYATGIVDIQ